MLRELVRQVWRCWVRRSPWQRSVVLRRHHTVIAAVLHWLHRHGLYRTRVAVVSAILARPIATIASRSATISAATLIALAPTTLTVSPTTLPITARTAAVQASRLVRHWHHGRRIARSVLRELVRQVWRWRVR